MNNTPEVDFAGHELGSEVFERVIVILWIIGICVSIIGLLIQCIIFTTISNSRKFDEVIVHEMTIARILYTTLEYLIIYYSEYLYIIKCIILIMYLHADMVMLCLMFIFTKNLYNKIVVVLPILNYRLAVTSAVTWIAPLPLSIPYPFILIINESYYKIYSHVYMHIKFFVCVLNALVFVEIIRVAFRRNVFMRTAIVTVILVSVTSLQVLVTDLISYYYEHIQSRCLLLIFCVINSYQALILTGIFIILVKKKMNDSTSMFRTLAIKLNDLKTTFT